MFNNKRLVLVWSFIMFINVVIWGFLSFEMGASHATEQMQPSVDARDKQIGKMAVENDKLRSSLVETAKQNEGLEQKVDKLRSTIGILGKELSGDWNFSDAVITAYSPLDDRNGINSEGNPQRTSIGMKVGYGKFAVDPARIPYGSRMLIIYRDGTIEEGVAADTGGALRNAKHLAIDVFRKTFNQAMAFGSNDAVVIWQAPKEGK